MMFPADRMVSSLEDLLALHRELLAASREKTQAMVAVDVAAVAAIGRAEDDLAGQVRLADGALREALHDFAAGLGLDPRGLRLSHAAAQVGEPQRTRLRALRADLGKLGAELQRVNRLNRSLSEQSLQQVGSVLAALATSDGGLLAYRRPGPAPARTTVRSIVLDRIA